MKQTRAGLGFGIGAYALWGLFPLYFGLISVVSPLEVVPWRVATTLVFCVVLVSVTRHWSHVRRIFRDAKRVGWFTLSALMLYANWQIFIIGVMTDRVIETALGYFINPIFTIMIGVVVRKERLSRPQWVAVCVASLGTVIAAIGYGTFPWIALGIATSFGLYGALHKHVAENTDGVTGLTVETLLTLPVAAAQLGIIAGIGGVTAFNHGAGISTLVLLSGVMTAIPLILFGEAARRLPLSYLGFVQFLTPILSFLYGFFILHESVSVTRWIGFIGVWVALVILIIDMWRAVRRSPEAEPNTAPIPLD